MTTDISNATSNSIFKAFGNGCSVTIEAIDGRIVGGSWPLTDHISWKPGETITVRWVICDERGIMLWASVLHSLRGAITFMVSPPSASPIATR
jgi:hypothetical protein